MSEVIHSSPAWSPSLLPKTGVVLAGVSGGSDSMALLELLAQALPNAAPRLAAVHVHHGLRGAEADRDQQLVVAACRRLGVLCVVYLRDARQEAKQRGQSLEEAGRSLRQECFLDAARLLGAKAIVLAHHRDDRAETLLLNLARGAGSRGLASLAATRPFPHPLAPPELRLIRPLLNVSKAELEAYLRVRNVRWRQDRSNRDVSFRRNRIRRRVIPMLERELQLPVRFLLARSAEVLARDDEFLQDQAERAFPKLAQVAAGQAASFSCLRLLGLPEPLRWRVLSSIWDRLKIPGKSLAHLQSLEKVLVEKEQTLALPGKWILRIQSCQARFAPPESEHPAPVTYALTVKPIPVPRDFRIVPKGAGYIQVDAGKLIPPVTIRQRKPGDTLTVLGQAGGRKTIKKIMAEMKIPSRQRASWPLVYMGRDRIIWIYRGPMSEEVKLDGRSNRAVKIEVKKRIGEVGSGSI